MQWQAISTLHYFLTVDIYLDEDSAKENPYYKEIIKRDEFFIQMLEDLAAYHSLEKIRDLYEVNPKFAQGLSTIDQIINTS